MVTIPLVLLLGFLAFAMVKWGGHKTAGVVVGVLFGLALASTAGRPADHPGHDRAVGGFDVRGQLGGGPVTAQLVEAAAVATAAAVAVGAVGRPVLADRAATGLAWWRLCTRYRPLWPSALKVAGLDQDPAGRAPRLMRVTSTRRVDVLRVQRLPGPAPEDYAAAASRLAATLGAVECRVQLVPGRPHLVELWLRVSPSHLRRADPPRPADLPTSAEFAAAGPRPVLRLVHGGNERPTRPLTTPTRPDLRALTTETP